MVDSGVHRRVEPQQAQKNVDRPFRSDNQREREGAPSGRIWKWSMEGTGNSPWWRTLVLASQKEDMNEDGNGGKWLCTHAIS